VQASSRPPGLPVVVLGRIGLIENVAGMTGMVSPASRFSAVRWRSAG